MPSNENLSISEIIFISMEENNINHDHIDLRLNCIENSINKIEKHLSNNITDIKTVDEKEFTINSMYENAKEFKDFIDLVHFCGGLALGKLFLPLIMHYYPQYPYIMKCLETYVRKGS